MHDLFDRARRGDESAQGEIDRIIRRIAQAVCRGGGPGGADADWEDVAQEAARQFFAVAIHQFRKTGAEESFLYAIVRTTLLQSIRAASRRRNRESIATQQITSMSQHNPGPAIDVRSILSRLSDECATLLDRVFLQGSSYATLAGELDMLESSVRTKVTRCLRRARELSGEGEG